MLCLLVSYKTIVFMFIDYFFFSNLLFIIFLTKPQHFKSNIIKCSFQIKTWVSESEFLKYKFHLYGLI